MRRHTDAFVLGLVGAVACCGLTVFLSAAVGVPILGLATEAWVLALAGTVAVAALWVRRATRQSR